MKQSQVLITVSDLLGFFFLGSFPERGLYFSGGEGGVLGLPIGGISFNGGVKKSEDAPSLPPPAAPPWETLSIDISIAINFIRKIISV